MAQEHYPGCDRQHTPRQLCSVARAEAAAAVEARTQREAVAAATAPAAWIFRPAAKPQPPKVYPPLSRSTARKAVFLELMPAAMFALSLALIAGVIALALALQKNSPLWLLAAPPVIVLLVLSCAGGTGWSFVSRPKVGCAMVLFQTGLVFFAFISALAYVDTDRGSYRDAAGSLHTVSAWDSSEPFIVTCVLALAAPVVSAFALRRHARTRIGPVAATPPPSAAPPPAT